MSREKELWKKVKKNKITTESIQKGDFPWDKPDFSG